MDTDFCLICRDEDEDVNLFLTRCNHKYHIECLSEWFKKRALECPLCRRVVSTNQLIEDIHSKRLGLADLIKNTFIKTPQIRLDDHIINWVLKMGNIEIITILYHHGIDLIDKAAQHGQLHIIKRLMIQDIRTVDGVEGVEADLVYCKKIQLKVVKYMLDKGSSSILDAMNSAVKDDRLDVIKFATERGFKCSTAVIDQAASRGNLKIIKYLLEKNMYCSPYAIDLAASNNHFAVVKYLVQRDKPCTPMAIISAILNGNLEIVKFLLEHERECTSDAVDMAILKGNVDILKYLLDNGQMCPQDAIERAAKYGHLELVKYLIDDYKLPCDGKAIDSAASSGHLMIVKYLVEKGMSSTAAAIDSAAQYGHLEVIKYLAQSNRRRNCTLDALNNAAQFGHLDIVKFLVQNHFPCSLQAAIKFASETGQTAIFEYLQERQNGT